MSFQSLKVVGFGSLVVSCFIGYDEAFMQGADHFVESSELIVVGVKWRHIDILLYTHFGPGEQQVHLSGGPEGAMIALQGKAPRPPPG